jgi:26S proteasome regulatory subunit N3
MPAYKMHLDEPKSEPEAESEAQPQPELAPDSPAVVTLKSIASSLVLVERSVQTKEPRFVSRALRQTVSARKKMTFPVLSYALERLPASDLKDLSLTFVAMGTGMEMGEPDEFTVELAAPSVECQIYLVILAIQFLLDQKTLVGEAYALSGQLVAFAQAQNRRTGDALTAQSVYYHSLAAECLGTLPALRPKLLAAHRTAVLNHDEIGQAMCVLGYYRCVCRRLGVDFPQDEWVGFAQVH